MINAVLDIIETNVPTGGYTEPVSLADVKAYMKIDYSDDDDLITALITAARENLERYTGLSFVEKSLTVQFDNSCGGIELPCGPVTQVIDISTFIDIRSSQPYDPSVIVISGNQFKRLDYPMANNLQISYSAGYISGKLPNTLIAALKAQVFFNYENRGEIHVASGSNNIRQYGVSYVCDAAKQLCKFYKRNTELSL